MYQEPNQQQVDRDWNRLKQEYLRHGFSEVEFLQAQLAFAKFGGPVATEVKGARRKAMQTFKD